MVVTEERSGTRPGAAPSTEEGALLLWMGGGMIYSVNGSALLLWRCLEECTTGLDVESLADYFGRCFDEVPSRERLVGDVSRLLGQLDKQGLLVAIERPQSAPLYKIKDDVFRTVDVVATDGGAGFDPALAYKPGDDGGAGRQRLLADTLLGLVALVAYDVVIKLRGFGGLCRVVERWPLAGGRAHRSPRVRQVCAGIDRARVWYPKQVQCLQHSAVVTCLLRRQGVDARMVIAGRRMPFYAHAWSEVGETVVNDQQAVRATYSIFKRCLAEI